MDLEDVPQEVCSTINKVVNQLDIISTTLAVIEQRLESNENQAQQALSFFTALNKPDSTHELPQPEAPPMPEDHPHHEDEPEALTPPPAMESR